MKLFIDANVLVAVLNKEYPLFTYAARLLSLADTKKYTLYTSPLCLAIAFYFAEKKSGRKVAKEKINLLCTHIRLSAHNEHHVKLALANKKIQDLEDGLEYYSALESKCEAIISHDLKGFHFSEIPVHTPEAFLKKVLKKEY
jgi:predicted nucleic acid-binding protein